MSEGSVVSDIDLISYVTTDLGVDEAISVDTELFSSGLLDSVGMMGLITYLEERCRVDVRPSDVTLDHFDTVSRIVAYAASLV